MAVSWRVPAALAFGVIPVLAWPAWVTVLAWTVAVVLVTAVDALLAVAPRSLGLSRQVPPSARLSETVASTVEVDNASRRTARLMLRDAWPPSAGAAPDRHRVRVPAGETRRVRTPLTPTRRGLRRAAQITVRSFGPLGLGARQRSVQMPAQVRILPEFRSRTQLPSRLARLRELDGRAAVHLRGQGTEFDSLREYQLGDDVRSIDWRATARGEKVVVRTWRPERDRRVVIVLDASRWSAGRIGDTTRLDAGIEACLLLGALAAAGGDRVDLIVYDRVARARAASSTKNAVVSALSTALSTVDPSLVEADWRGIVATVQDTSRQRSLLVLLTSTDPALVEEGLGPVAAMLAAKHTVLVATVRDPEEATLRLDRQGPGAAYDAAASERRELSLLAMESALRSLGLHTVASFPEALPGAVCDAYLALKAAGRL
ncbi:MAG: DUF58 domain-containing protein [Bifidobacteriaceae bacterium]|jgi:uncharacterized protein (DUF58 family)|nr:DUF58 domain-containing protein [Bifidobacteriaceae bacterium]